MENQTAQGWALLLSAKSYKTILVLCQSSRPRNAEPPFSYDCPFHINPQPKVCNPHSLERHSEIVGNGSSHFQARFLGLRFAKDANKVVHAETCNPVRTCFCESRRNWDFQGR